MVRRNLTFKVVLEALKERSTLDELGAEVGVVSSQISRWVKKFKENRININLVEWR